MRYLNLPFVNSLLIMSAASCSSDGPAETVDDTKVRFLYDNSPYGMFATENTIVAADDKAGTIPITGEGEISMSMGTEPAIYHFTLSASMAPDKKDAGSVYAIPDVTGGPSITLH